jgi:hypothetical protein
VSIIHLRKWQITAFHPHVVFNRLHRGSSISHKMHVFFIIHGWWWRTAPCISTWWSVMTSSCYPNQTISLDEITKI